MNFTQTRILSTLLLGWSTGLWLAGAVLMAIPLSTATERATLAPPLAAVVCALLVLALVLRWPADTPAQAAAMVFGALVVWSAWLLWRDDFSAGLPMALMAGVAGLVLCALRLQPIHTPHAMPWLLWAALLEGLALMMPLTALLPTIADALGMVVVLGFLWMLASVFGGVAGHRAFEAGALQASPIVAVCLVPWGVGAASLVLGVAMGQTGVWVAWGYMVASLLSGWAAFGSRRRLLQHLDQAQTENPTMTKPLPLIQTTFANMLSRFCHQLPDDDVLNCRD